MTVKDAETQAQAYIDKVLESQRELGHESKLSRDEYERAVARAAQAFVDLAEPAPDQQEEGVPA
jgi:hypothetical protein